MLYSKSRIYAQLNPKPVPHALGHGRNQDKTGLILAFADNLERVDSSISITSLEGSVGGRGKENTYTVDFRLDGKVEHIQAVIRKINSGEIFVHQNPVHEAAAKASSYTMEVPLKDRKSLYVKMVDVDKPGLVKQFCLAALPGAVTWIHCETENAGRFENTGDFVLHAQIGYANVEDAEAARAKLLALKSVEFPERQIDVWRLYRVGGLPNVTVQVPVPALPFKVRSRAA